MTPPPEVAFLSVQGAKDLVLTRVQQQQGLSPEETFLLHQLLTRLHGERTANPYTAEAFTLQKR